MLCSSKSPQKQIDRATCLNKLQASGVHFMKIWVIGQQWCHPRAAQPGFTPAVSPAPLSSLASVSVPSAGAVSNPQRSENLASSQRTNCC